MTVKQLLIGTLVGAGAIGLMLHRLPKLSSKNAKSADKQTAKQPTPQHPLPSKATG